MPYDEDLDVELFQGNIETDNGVLRVSVWSYNQGDPKLQIGPRVYTKKDGNEGYRKAGRITAEEFEQLLDMTNDIQEHMGV